MSPARIFGREPALIMTVVATGIRLLCGLVFDFTEDQQALLNAAVAAVASLIVARSVRRGEVLPSVLGVVQALLALAVGFGFEISAEWQAAVMSFVGAAAALFIRQNVVAPVPADPAETRVA